MTSSSAHKHRLFIQLWQRGPGGVSVCRFTGAEQLHQRHRHRAHREGQGERSAAFVLFESRRDRTQTPSVRHLSPPSCFPSSDPSRARLADVRSLRTGAACRRINNNNKKKQPLPSFVHCPPLFTTIAAMVICRPLVSGASATP